MAVTFTLKAKWVFDADGTSDWSLEAGAEPFTATAGKMLVLFQNGFKSNPGAIPLPADSNGTFVTYSNGEKYTYPMTIRIARIENCAGGSHSITPPSLVVNDDGYLWIYEVDEFPSAPTLTSANAVSNVSSSKTWNISSANGTPVAGDVAMAFTHYENSSALATTDISNPTSYTQLDVEQNAQSNLPTQLCWRQLPSGGSQTVTWTETLDNNKTDDFSVLVTVTPNLGFPKLLTMGVG